MNNMTLTPIETYLFADKNSHAKESLINNRLIYDLKFAAVEAGYFLNIYTPEVDKDGFDIIFDDQDSLTKVQLKTVMKKASTNSWKIHKTLLRPEPHICEDLGFEPSPSGTGYQGGIILIEISDGVDGFSIDYYYTDVIILCGIRDKILELVDAPSDKAIKTLLKSIMNGIASERVSIYKNMFLRANNPGALLALMGLHNNKYTSVWRYHIQKMTEPCNQQELAAPYIVLKREINQELRDLSSSIAIIP